MLSPREREVLVLIAHGAADRDVSAMLGITFSTARKYRENLKIKLGVRKSAQLAMFHFSTLAAQAKRQTNPFSARERQILYWLARGMSDKELARKVGISDLTARKHRENMFRKTGVGNVCQLLALACNQAWLESAAIVS
jgi:DNA-binding CsgD family transcriptional regulator